MAECAKLLQSIINSQHESMMKRSAIITLLNYNATNQPSVIASMDVLQVAIEWYLHTDVLLKNELATIMLKLIVKSDIEFCRRQLLNAHRLQLLLTQSTNVSKTRIAQFFQSVVYFMNRFGNSDIDIQVLQVLMACMMSWDSLQAIDKMATLLSDHCCKQGHAGQLCLVLVLCISRYNSPVQWMTDDDMKIVHRMCKLIGRLGQEQPTAINYTVASILSLAMSINVLMAIPDISGDLLRNAVVNYFPTSPSPLLVYTLQYLSVADIKQSVIAITGHTAPFPDALLSLAAERILDWFYCFISKPTDNSNPIIEPGWPACILQFYISMIKSGRDKVIDCALRNKIDQVCLLSLTIYSCISYQ